MVTSSHRKIKGANSGPSEVKDSPQVYVIVEGGMVNLQVLVTAIHEPVILGTDFLRAAEVTVDFRRGTVSVRGRTTPQISTVCRCVVNDSLREPEKVYIEEESG